MPVLLENSRESACYWIDNAVMCIIRDLLQWQVSTQNSSSITSSLCLYAAAFPCQLHANRVLFYMTVTHLTLPAMSLQETGKRKADDAEAVALASDELIAKRQARFKTQEQTAEEQRKQRFMDPETIKAKERKERFGKWLPESMAAKGKSTKDDVVTAIASSLDKSVPAKGRGSKPASAAPKEEKYSDEFLAKAEVGLLLVHQLLGCMESECKFCSQGHCLGWPQQHA